MTPLKLYKSRIRRTQAADPKNEDGGTLLRWLKTAGLTTAVLSGVGALFGYGVSLGLSGTFGLGSGVWYSTALELISLCGEGLLGVVSAVSSRFDLKVLLLLMAAYGAAVAFMALLVVITVIVLAHQEQRINNLRSSISKWLVAPRKDEKVQPSLNTLKRAIVMVFAAGAVGSMAVPAVVIALIGLFAVVSIIPMIGFYAGTAYAKEVILQPKSCVSPLKVRAKLEKLPRSEKRNIGADCLEVTNAETGEKFSGRLVIARSTHVVLYRPKEDDVVVVVIKTGSMRTIHTLDASP